MQYAHQEVDQQGLNGVTKYIEKKSIEKMSIKLIYHFSTKKSAYADANKN